MLYDSTVTLLATMLSSSLLYLQKTYKSNVHNVFPNSTGRDETRALIREGV